MPPFNENPLARSYQDEVDNIVTQLLSITPGVGYVSAVEELKMRSQDILTIRYGKEVCGEIIEDAIKTHLERTRRGNNLNEGGGTDLFPHISPRDQNAPRLGTEIAGDQGEDR